MGCVDSNGKQWPLNTTICENGVQKKCGADGNWVPTGNPCDGTEANAPGNARAGDGP